MPRPSPSSVFRTTQTTDRHSNIDLQSVPPEPHTETQITLIFNQYRQNHTRRHSNIDLQSVPPEPHTADTVTLIFNQYRQNHTRRRDFFGVESYIDLQSVPLPGAWRYRVRTLGLVGPVSHTDLQSVPPEPHTETHVTLIFNQYTPEQPPHNKLQTESTKFRSTCDTDSLTLCTALFDRQKRLVDTRTVNSD